MNEQPILNMQQVQKTHRRGWFGRRKIFSLQIDLAIDMPSVLCIIGLNGSGKSSLFDLIAGLDTPTSGRILCHGQDIQEVKRAERVKLVRYHRQSQFKRHLRRRFPPEFALKSAASSAPTIHLFDEPNEGDWITRLFFYSAMELRAQGNVVLFAMHPGKMRHLAMMRGVCDGFIFAEDGRYTRFASFEELNAYPPASQYLAPLQHIG